ncbi:uncharacterized protein PG986_007557 [Apiospora aurea]|uniref:Uncharacterized protein n=1 Tax=Apiospora aurea TaxID=335848 RepID=A0ABR1QCW8_9PEZI
MVFLTRLVSMTNFAVASSALGFQVFVLYPWHITLDESFEELKKEHIKVLGAVSDIAKAVDPDERKGLQKSILSRMSAMPFAAAKQTKP